MFTLDSGPNGFSVSYSVRHGKDTRPLLQHDPSLSCFCLKFLKNSQIFLNIVGKSLKTAPAEPYACRSAVVLPDERVDIWKKAHKKKSMCFVLIPGDLWSLRALEHAPPLFPHTWDPRNQEPSAFLCFLVQAIVCNADSSIKLFWQISSSFGTALWHRLSTSTSIHSIPSVSSQFWESKLVLGWKILSVGVSDIPDFYGLLYSMCLNSMRHCRQP